MKRCTLCHLSETRKNVVAYRGSPHPKVLFIGESPGRREDETGIPFVGPAGRVLARAIGEISLPDEDFGITNVFMCRPRGNLFDPVAAGACRGWLELKLEVLKPRVIVTLGSHAVRALLPDSPPVFQISGEVRSWGAIPLFPMLHPASTLRNSKYRVRWASDIAIFRSSLPVLLSSPDGLK